MYINLAVVTDDGIGACQVGGAYSRIIVSY
jgi:hypothetical protein